MATDKQIKILVEDILDAAHEILGDFDSYGPVLQKDPQDCYGPLSSIEMLRTAVCALESTTGN